MVNFTRRAFGGMAGSAALLAALGMPSRLAAQTPIPGGLLRIVAGVEPPILIEILQNAGQSGVGARVVEGLLSEDTERNQVGQLAESWEVSEDSRIFTFKLREGVKWHDGASFTSADVAYTYWQLKEIHPRRRATFAHLEEIDDSDPLTVVLKFSQPAPFLLPALNAYLSPIVPKHLYEGTDVRTNPYNSAPVGTGPFRFVEWVRGSHVHLERNPEYRDSGYPLFDEVLIRFIPDPVARLAAFEAGEIDIGFSNPVPVNELERLRQTGQFEINPNGYALSGSMNQFFFNLRFEPFKDLRVRQAFAHAIDIPSYIERVWLGYAEPSPTIIPPSNPALHDASLSHYAYDTALSERLLDEAGYPRRADGTRFSIRLTANPFTQQVLVGAQFLRSALTEIGIDVQLQNYDFPTYVKQVYTEGAFDLDIQNLAAGYDPTDGIQRGYHSQNIKDGLAWSNHSHYRSAEADELFDKGAVEPDPEKRREIYLQLQRRIHDDLPVVNLVAQQFLTVARTSLRDYFIDQQGSNSSFVRAWSTET